MTPDNSLSSHPNRKWMSIRTELLFQIQKFPLENIEPAVLILLDEWLYQRLQGWLSVCCHCFSVALNVTLGKGASMSGSCCHFSVHTSPCWSGTWYNSTELENCYLMSVRTAVSCYQLLNEGQVSKTEHVELKGIPILFCSICDLCLCACRQWA